MNRHIVRTKATSSLRHLLRSGEPLESRALLSATGLPPVPEVQSLDGSGNNPMHEAWGTADAAFLRVAEAAYADGSSAPSGADRPSARLISNALAESPPEGIVNDRNLSAFVYAWGQFLDHDLTLTDTAVPMEMLVIDVPEGDPWFDPAGSGTAVIPLSRSAYDPGTGTIDPRQQVNSISAYLDGSQIYGVDAERSAALREFVGGRLVTSAGDLLPYNTAGLPNGTIGLVPAEELFLAGDVRANENPELIALHTLFVREHNRIADEAAVRHPEWTDEQLFQHARRIVIAELQAITFNEFLPALFGQRSDASATVRNYAGYRSDVNAGITNEFATAAYRFGHSMLGDDIAFLDDVGNEVRDALGLREAFFNAAVVAETGIEPILKYLASDRAQEIDTRVVDDVRNFLFGAPGQGGFDLAALNIERGRDHGLGDYNAVREAFGLARVTSFAEITTDLVIQETLAATYASIDDLDLWVAGLAEQHLPGSSLGETFTAILVDQFTRLRDGDRFWYENVLPRELVHRIEETSLADIVRRNTSLTSLQCDLFFFNVSIEGLVFDDANGDGRQQRGEPGLPGQLVNLVDGEGVVVATAKTDARGHYAFTGLELGTYQLVVGLPDGLEQTSGRPLEITRGADIDHVMLGVAVQGTHYTKPVLRRPDGGHRPGPEPFDPRTLAGTVAVGGHGPQPPARTAFFAALGAARP
jgi:peroxidase